MLHPSALTTPRPDVGRALTTLAKRCARALGSDRRPRRHVSTNTTPRFCVHHGPRRHLRQAGRACLCKGEEGSRTWGKCRADTRGWRAQCFSRTTLGIGCEAWVLRPVRLPPAPESCRPDRPPVCTPCARHQQSSPQANRATADAEAPRVVWAHTAPRPPIGAELRGASFGEHRLLATLLQPALCQAEHMGRAAPPSSRATPAAELCAPGARALGRQSGRHRRRDQREERRGQHEPHIALSAHLHTRHSPLTDDLRHPTSHLTGGARRLSGQDGSSVAVRQLTTSTGVLRHRPHGGWRLALSLRSPAPPSAGMLGWGGQGVAGGAGWPTAQPLATRLGWARGL